MSALPQKKSAVKPRSNPEPRWVDAAAPWSRLLNRDPNKHYVYVHKNSEMMGIEYYEALGYTVTRRDPKDPNSIRPLMNKQSSDAPETIELRGHVLMEIPLEDWKRIQEEGADGIGDGTKFFDQIEKRIVHQRGGADHLRGIQGLRGVRAENETTEATVEEQ